MVEAGVLVKGKSGRDLSLSTKKNKSSRWDPILGWTVYMLGLGIFPFFLPGSSCIFSSSLDGPLWGAHHGGSWRPYKR